MNGELNRDLWPDGVLARDRHVALDDYPRQDRALIDRRVSAQFLGRMERPAKPQLEALRHAAVSPIGIHLDLGGITGTKRCESYCPPV